MVWQKNRVVYFLCPIYLKLFCQNKIPFHAQRINCPYRLMDLEVFKPEYSSIVHCMCLRNDFMLFKLFYWLTVDPSDSPIYSVSLYLLTEYLFACECSVQAVIQNVINVCGVFSLCSKDLFRISLFTYFITLLLTSSSMSKPAKGYTVEFHKC